MAMPVLAIEYAATRDAHVPLHDGDPDMNDGYDCVTVPPANPDADQYWVAYGGNDKCTYWRRIYLRVES
jgi:hypothetical protein